MAETWRTALLSPEEYLEAERRAETKHEYWGGEIIAFAGASERHNLLVGNLIGSLGPQLRGSRCRAYPSDLRVRTRPDHYLYPDVTVVCGESRLADEKRDVLLNPTLVVEVLSPSTEARDRTGKLDQYRKVPSLQEYLLVAQKARRVQRYTRQESDFWLFSETTEPGAVLQLPSIGCTLALDDVYDRVF